MDATDDVVESRRDEVRAWQRAYHMEPRDDSRLTELYAHGTCTWPADVVARELVVTDFIFQNTPYGELLEDFMRALAARVRADFHLSWGATWEVARFYGPIALRLMCLDATGVRLPNLPPYVAPCETPSSVAVSDAAESPASHSQPVSHAIA